MKKTKQVPRCQLKFPSGRQCVMHGEHVNNGSPCSISPDIPVVIVASKRHVLVTE